MPEYVIEKEGKKYVAYVNGFWNTQVNYYNYENPLVTSKYKAITEDYGEGGFDPIGKESDYEILQTVYYDAKGNILKYKDKDSEIKSYSNSYNNYEKTNSTSEYYMEDNITTSNNVTISNEDSKYYATINNGEKVEIISPKSAADIADNEAKDLKYQYQPWESEFYSRGKNGEDYLDAKLTYGLEEIDRLYYWLPEWKVKDYTDCLMWELRLFDENDPLTSLYIFVDAKNGDIVGAGKSSD